MNQDTVYGKTELGRERFEARSIPTTLRHALILVDGRSTLKELLKKGEGLEHLEDSFEMLEQMGLIAPAHQIMAAAVVAATQPQPAKPAAQTATGAGGAPLKRMLVSLAMKLLGDNAEKIIRKIEETADSSIALMHTIDSCGKVIKLTIDEKKADEFVVAAKEILARKV
jgi:hypothetical protein